MYGKGKKINLRGIWFWVPVAIIRLVSVLFQTNPGLIEIDISPEVMMFLVNIVLNAVTAVLTLLGIFFLIWDNRKK